MIVLAATLKAKAGKEDELIAAMKKLVAAVRQNEPGALDYTLHRSKKDPATFLVYEKYRDDAAMKAHMGSVHFQEASKKFGELLAGPPGLEMFEVVE
ncbi:MAG: hypothetical protein A2V67_03990 [Deltaproteobacteria bacterium RBG_13_61_14]|nr:MAG: hypothetical protein A2V67_03990 [Deltaproteobacteria bacterium RBG_13_61_14]